MKLVYIKIEVTFSQDEKSSDPAGAGYAGPHPDKF